MRSTKSVLVESIRQANTPNPPACRRHLRKRAYMEDKTGKLFVVEPDDALRDHITALLNDAGFEVSTDYSGGMKAVLAFNPDVVVLGADPPQLDCCNLLSEIKASKHTHNIRVVMLSPGGPPERTRGMDLGAADS